MSRDRYVDFMRAWAILLVVTGHWLITALVLGPGGQITAPELLATIPWTQWLTLGFQIMPLFFLAGGHAAGGSWSRARETGDTAAGWVGQRALRLLLPVAVYSGLVLLAVGICSAVGVDPDTLALVGWAMAMQFWFLPVYLILSVLTPSLHAAHRRWGLLVPVVMGAAALAADALALAVRVPYIGLLNYVLVWGVAYQLGFCWRDGLLTGRRRMPAAMAAGGGLAFAVLITLGPFPVSLILVTGQDPSNTDPPSAAMLAWAVAQVGLCLLAAPAVRRLLDRERVWRAVRHVGGASMTLYLWHMLPVLVVAAAFYLTGIAPEPAFGSGAWWGLRLPWLLVLGVVLVGVLLALRPLERRQALLYERIRPAIGLRRPWPLWLGLATSVAALTWFAMRGFAYDGRFPALPALSLALGTTLVTAHRRRAVHKTPDEPKNALKRAA
ncbi:MULTISPECIES: acyltransferase [unclassified Streptomyces]|jgi:fucose 4-O-acetylase-like acetyltransferase|uniref:acyltransferase family protein n=1 Tax=unclassified Streptomyces TaxID=2593676 RepID=UPI0029B060CA|nr:MULTISPECIES: acyltransferase [unclassified Streptomyces]MDX3767409.1 acyltransferase [Streptomyces sp. AK08-01B]MDX3820193.1 acyltransferase [Streptomyces sp. AK08-01A]